MISPSQSHPIVHPTDSQSIIIQVSMHIQSACPSLPPSIVLHMAQGFEEHVRARASSRQDYVDRANAGVKSILESAQKGQFPNFVPVGTAEEGLATSTGPQVRQTSGSQNHGPVQNVPVNGRSQDLYSALERTAMSDPSPAPAPISTVNPLEVANDRLSLEALQDLVTAAASCVPMMNNPASTPVPVANNEISTHMHSLAPTSGQQREVSVQSAANSSGTQHKATLKKEAQDQGKQGDKKAAESTLKNAKEGKLSPRPTRSTSRGRPSRSSRNTTPSVSNSQSAAPSTKSKPRKAAKRPARKRPPKGKKRTPKQPEAIEPTEERGRVSTAAPQGRRFGQSSMQVEKPEASSSPLNNAGVTEEIEIRPNVSSMYKVAQEDKNHKYSIAEDHMNQMSDVTSLGSPQFLLSLDSGPMTINANNIASHKPISNYTAGDKSPPQPLDAIQAPIATTAHPSTSQAPLNSSQIPAHSRNTAENGYRIEERVRLCSNSDIEIDDGIRVSKEQIAVAASTMGITLTPDQLESMKRDQALHILVRASQFNLMRSNGALPITGPILPTQSPGDGRTHPFQSRMMGPFPMYPHLQTSKSSRAGLRNSNELGISFSKEQEGSHPGFSSSANPELRPAPSVQAAEQRSSPIWRFAANVPEVQARLRKFQLDYKMNVGFLQDQVSGMRANDNVIRYLRCCINLLSMEPTHVRGVSVEVIDSVERFLRNFLSNHAGSTAPSIQSGPVRVSMHGGVGGEPVITPRAPSLGVSDLQDPVRYVPSSIQTLSSNQSTLSHGVPKASEMPRIEHASASVGGTSFQPVGVAKPEAEKLTERFSKSDGVTALETKLIVASESKERKRKGSPCHELEKEGKRMATKVRRDKEKGCMSEDITFSRKGVGFDDENERETRIATGDMIDISDENGPPLGVAVYCQRDTNGNMFNFVRLSDRPTLDEVLGRLRFMLNSAMKLTVCYISVTENRREDKSRRLEKILVLLEPKKINGDYKNDKKEDERDIKGLSMVDLINVECDEARKRYGSLTVQMRLEFGRPVFRGIVGYNDGVSKLEFHIVRCGKGEKEVGYERPPMGWIGVLEHVRKLYCYSIDGMNGVEGMVRRWIHMKEELDGWHTTRED